ncbi:MAG: hypothetical protein JXA90_02820, partial [Planctomycetes bacterium]|nr:hypothetical protein [Planctomycetota bacterium]
MPPTSTLRPAAAAQRSLPWIALAVILASAGTSRAGDLPDFRSLVEADWSRQDEGRLRQIRERGRVRFVEEEIDWPGVAEERRQPLERIEPPVIDGRLDDPGWKDAWSPAGAE